MEIVFWFTKFFFFFTWSLFCLLLKIASALSTKVERRADDKNDIQLYFCHICENNLGSIFIDIFYSFFCYSKIEKYFIIKLKWIKKKKITNHLKKNCKILLSDRRNLVFLFLCDFIYDSMWSLQGYQYSSVAYTIWILKNSKITKLYDNRLRDVKVRCNYTSMEYLWHPVLSAVILENKSVLFLLLSYTYIYYKLIVIAWCITKLKIYIHIYRYLQFK